MFAWGWKCRVKTSYSLSKLKEKTQQRKNHTHIKQQQQNIKHKKKLNTLKRTHWLNLILSGHNLLAFLLLSNIWLIFETVYKYSSVDWYCWLNFLKQHTLILVMAPLAHTSTKEGAVCNLKYLYITGPKDITSYLPVPYRIANLSSLDQIHEKGRIDQRNHNRGWKKKETEKSITNENNKVP